MTSRLTPGSFRTRGWLPPRVARRSRTLLLGGIWLRFLTWRRSLALDADLARGTAPTESDELSLRAGRLRSAGRRARLAAQLAGVVEVAERPIHPFSRVALRRREVRASKPLLVAIAKRLREPGLLDVQGLAMTSLLVNDHTSPLYQGASPSLSLTEAASSALVALDRCGTRTKGRTP
jgi:hypothetical protein